MNIFNSPLDLSRIKKLIDTKTLSNCVVSIVGTGGSTGVIDMLTRSGIRRFQLVDPDIVESVNLTNQLYGQKDLGKAKVKATKKMIKRINPEAKILTYHKRYEELRDKEHKYFWQVDIVLAMTDSFEVQAHINEDAFYWHNTDGQARQVIFAGCYENMIAAEIVYLKTHFTSCYKCQTKARYEAFEAGKIKTPNGASSHHLAGQFRNVLVAYMAISSLHPSKHHFSEIIKGFYQDNMLLAKLHSDFTNDTFDQEPIFTIKQYPDNDPDCEYCNSQLSNKVVFDDHVIDSIVSTIGKKAPETGGILGGDLDKDPLHITRFEYVTASNATSSTYQVDAPVMNDIIERIWSARNQYLSGIVHSHPGNMSNLSLGDNNVRYAYGDCAFFETILTHEDSVEHGLKTLIAPVVNFDSSGKLKITVWLVHRNSPYKPEKTNAFVLHNEQRIPLDSYLSAYQ